MTSCTHILPEIQTRSTKFSNLEMRPPSRSSAVGKGTIMRLSFAIRSAPATSFAVWSALSSAPALRVLVVDDDPRRSNRCARLSRAGVSGRVS